MKPEKKEKLIRKQKSRNILIRNKKINKINVFIFAAGLLLMFIGQEQIASILIWTGVAILVYTILSSIFAHRPKI